MQRKRNFGRSVGLNTGRNKLFLKEKLQSLKKMVIDNITICEQFDFIDKDVYLLQQDNIRLKEKTEKLEEDKNKRNREIQETRKMSNKIKEDIKALMEDRENLEQLWKAATRTEVDLNKENITRKDKMQDIENQIKIYKIPDPKLAIQKLFQENDPIFLYSIKKIDQKKLLLQYALQTNDYNTIVQVILYLEYTMLQDLFKDILCQNVESFQYYLKYLKAEDKHKFKNLCLELKEYRELGSFMYEEALKEFEFSIQIKQLETCLSFCKEHEILDQITSIESSLESAKIASTFMN